MKAWFIHNVGLKILSVVLAIIVWFLINEKLGTFSEMNRHREDIQFVP
jgi:hypothetical protein